jgi:hypothetical protein
VSAAAPISLFAVDSAHQLLSNGHLLLTAHINDYHMAMNMCPRPVTQCNRVSACSCRMSGSHNHRSCRHALRCHWLALWPVVSGADLHCPGLVITNVLRCAVLCCAVLCCAVLCCAVLCCALLCPAVLCCAVLCCAVLCCALLCPAVLQVCSLAWLVGT